MGEIGQTVRPVFPSELGAIDPVVRETQEFIQPAELIEDLHCCRMYRIAPEIAEEIGMLLQHQNVDTGPGQQQARHHPRRPSPDNDHVMFHHSACLSFTIAHDPHPSRTLGRPATLVRGLLP